MAVRPAIPFPGMLGMGLPPWEGRVAGPQWRHGARRLLYVLLLWSFPSLTNMYGKLPFFSPRAIGLDVDATAAGEFKTIL